MMELVWSVLFTEMKKDQDISEQCCSKKPSSQVDSWWNMKAKNIAPMNYQQNYWSAASIKKDENVVKMIIYDIYDDICLSYIKVG